MRRSVVVVCLVAVCAVIVVVMGWRESRPLAGLFDHGDQSVPPVALVDPGHPLGGTSVIASFHWDDPNWCPDLFIVTAEETDSRVVVSDVRVRSTPGHVACFRGGAPKGTALADLTLKSPLGSREIVRATDGQVLPIRDRP